MLRQLDCCSKGCWLDAPAERQKQAKPLRSSELESYGLVTEKAELCIEAWNLISIFAQDRGRFGRWAQPITERGAK